LAIPRLLRQNGASGEVVIVMGEAGEIGALIARLIAQQAPFVQIVISLAAAFSLLMFIEGMRASFIPTRKPRDRQEPVPQPPRAPRKAIPLKPLRSAASKPRKRVREAVKLHKAPRPKIRRIASDRPDAASNSGALPQVASFEE
jgi:hypothetical protein